MVSLKQINIRNALQVIGVSGGLALFVFATITVAAPTVISGVVITIAVYVLTFLALLGLRSKQSILNAVQHLAVATIVALPIALLFGVFWAGESITTLLSPAFFTSVANISFLFGLFGGALADARTR